MYLFLINCAHWQFHTCFYILVAPSAFHFPLVPAGPSSSLQIFFSYSLLLFCVSQSLSRPVCVGIFQLEIKSIPQGITIHQSPVCSPGSIQLEAMALLFSQNPLCHQRSAVLEPYELLPFHGWLRGSHLVWPSATFAQGCSQDCCNLVVTRSWHFTGLLSVSSVSYILPAPPSANVTLP